MSDNAAVVLGMFETGLAVGRSLGRAGVRVIGLDCARKVGFHSRFIDARICPHPSQETEFIDYLLGVAEQEIFRPVLYITSDEFLLPVSRNRKRLEGLYLLNLPGPEILECIADKYRQYTLALEAGIPVPKTFVANNMEELEGLKGRIPFPAFIKGAEVTLWRSKMGVASKGFVVNDPQELMDRFRLIFERGANGLIQELIPGPDTNHYKSSCYVSKSGEVLLAFGLQKIRQQPAGFGFGCLVRSIEYPEMVDLGKEFFNRIGYRGVGSSEFKLDPRDGKLKLIELNPRYWQQNGLPDRCGMNFPLINYLDLVGEEPKPVSAYRPGVKWVNIYCDIESFREYRRRGELSWKEWLGSLRGEIMLSDLEWDDPVPGLREILVENLCRRSARFLRTKVGKEN
ncbi:MAG: carbamoyl-phosphate synthase chain, binding domain protein [Deltaproteobacteria bacterium]|nr:carbamoyl-phosphate synthase chain, binding domain protein [Deltaproteobacteria bacterium]